MIFRPLGKTGMNVSVVSLGTLTMGPLQKVMSPDDGSKLITDALGMGINCFDTAEIYGTYEHIKKAELPEDGSSFVVSKSYAADYDEMAVSLKGALDGLSRSYIDLFMLHQQESELTLKGHQGALDCLIDARESGLVKSIGISTHHIRAVNAASGNKDIDVIFAILNYKGLGIVDGSREEMEDALARAYGNDKGILIMKALGGGHFFRETKQAFDYISDLPFVSSVVVGAQSAEELRMNIFLMEKNPVPDDLLKMINGKRRMLNIEFDSCAGCGACVKRCPQGALSIVGNKAAVEHEKCVLCAYCASVCPDFCIEVV